MTAMGVLSLHNAIVFHHGKINANDYIYLRGNQSAIHFNGHEVYVRQPISREEQALYIRNVF
jgi:hypothetical protein